jgi:hypothetical protein
MVFPIATLLILARKIASIFATRSGVGWNGGVGRYAV